MASENCIVPLLKGFSVEFAESNMVFNIQDVNGSLIAGADVTVDCNGVISTGQSDLNGCVSLLIRPEQKCSITITKANYHDYTADIVLLQEADLNDPTRNYIIRVEDGAGVAIDAADVTITSAVHNDVGNTNSFGIFEGTIETDCTNDVSISKTGFQTQNIQYQSFIPFSCESDEFRVVPVITLTT